MSKVLFIGDTHFDDRTPISRNDNYSITSISKLSQVINIAKKRKIRYIILTGDAFDKNVVSAKYLNEVLKTLRDAKEQGITFYSIIGNHDLPYNSHDQFNRSLLSILFLSGLVIYLDAYRFDDIKTIVYGLDYGRELKPEEVNAPITRDPLKKILVAHYGLVPNMSGKDALTEEQLSRFDLVVLGHDHNYYEPKITKDGVVILRSGALVRKTKAVGDIDREVCIYEVDLDTLKYEKILLDIEPASNVFKEGVFLETTKEFGNFADIFKDSYFRSKQITLFDKIDNLPLPVSEQTKKELKDYFIKEGIEG